MRVLIATFGTAGDLFPYLALGRGLAVRGHAVSIATHAYWRETVERDGFGFHPVRPDAEPGNRALLARALDPRRGPEVVIREILMPRLRESYQDTAAAAGDADLIVAHPLAFAGRIVAEERRLPWVSTVLSPISLFSRHDAPVIPLAPWVKRLDRAPGVLRLMMAAGRALTRPWVEPVARLRAERGLPPGGQPLFEGQHSPYAVLALFSRILAEPQPDWPPNVRVTGFLFHDPPWADPADEARLEAFLAAGRPPVVFTLGSSAVEVAGSFYDESLAAARRLGIRSVLLVGTDAANRPTGLGDDALALEQAPHHALFPRAAAVVHHGGIGTLGQALRAGRPMLIVPHAHDQPDNAHRAERLGVARSVPRGRYRAARVARAVGALLAEPACAERAAEVGRIVRFEDSVTAACEMIELAATLRRQAPASD